MEIAAEFTDGFLCPKNGTIHRVHEFELESESCKLIQAGRLQLIPTITSQDLYLLMVDFASTVENPKLQEKLENALKGISAVWKFRNALYHQTELSKQWEEFKKEKLLKQAKDWLETLGA